MLLIVLTIIVDLFQKNRRIVFIQSRRLFEILTLKSNPLSARDGDVRQLPGRNTARRNPEVKRDRYMTSVLLSRFGPPFFFAYLFLQYVSKSWENNLWNVSRPGTIIKADDRDSACPNTSVLGRSLLSIRWEEKCRLNTLNCFLNHQESRKDYCPLGNMEK